MASSRNSISRTISVPRTGCSWIAANSSSDSPPVFCRTRVGTPSLPRSCRIAAYFRVDTRSSRMPTTRAISSDARATRSLWPRVYRSLVSTAAIMVVTVRS